MWSKFKLILLLVLTAGMARAQVIIPVNFAEKIYVNSISKNSSAKVLVKDDVYKDGKKLFSKGNVGYVKIEYDKGDFLTRSFTGIWGHPTIKIYEATIYDDAQKAHKCLFSTSKKKVKRFRDMQGSYYVHVDDNLASAAISNALSPVDKAISDKVNIINPNREYYAFVDE